MTDDAPSIDNLAEQSVLGAMLLTPEAAADAAAVITAEDFHRPAHELIFTAIVALAHEGLTADIPTVADRLAREKNLVRCGGPVYLFNLAHNVPTPGMAAHYAHIVRGHAHRRRLAAVGTRLHQMGTRPDTDLDDIVDLYTAAIRDLNIALDATPAATTPTAADLVAAVLDDIENPPDAADIPTGIHDLDAILGGGLKPAQLVLIAARPSIGKSVAGLTVARAAARCGVRTLFATIEMTEAEVMRRLICAEAKVNMHHVQGRAVDDRDWALIAGALPRITALPLHIAFDSGFTIAALHNILRSHARTEPIGLVVIDYLQIMGGARGATREQAVAGLARELKRTAQEFGIPVVALAQLNRGSEQRTNKRPSMADLRESGALEQEADVVVLMHREDAYQRESPRAGECDLIMEKNRAGATATVTVAFQGHYSRLVDMAAEPWTPHAALRSVA